MEKQLFEIGNHFINEQRLSITCIALILLQVIVLFSNLGFIGAGASMSRMSDGLHNAIGIFLQPLQDLCLLILFFALFVALYKRNIIIPIASYVVILLFATTVLTFLAKFSGNNIGLLLGLISLACYILVCILGVKLRKTPFARLGTTFIVFSVFDIVDGLILKGSNPIMFIISLGIMIYLALTFKNSLSTEFEVKENNQ